MEDPDSEYVKPKMWYEEISDAGRTQEALTDDLVIQLKTEAEKSLIADAANYNIKNSKGNSNFQWMKTVMAKGITSDKVAAYIVTIQSKPLYNLDALSNLVGMVKVGKKNEFVIIIDSLIELFLENLLIPHRKLLSFHTRPLTKLDELSSGNAATRKKYLAYWIFEDQLKQIYTTFVLSLNKISHDTVEKSKEKAIGALKKLLAGNPEQEQNLLKHLVNKLGDPSKKIASKVIYLLSSLLNQHSNMQGVVLNEVEKVLFRTNVSSRTQYYALCFLSQFYLNHENKAIAEHLIGLYFSFFKACVKKGEVNSRMMSVLLMGVNRAFPYAELELSKLSDHIDTMYRIVHIANFNVSLHALRLLHQVSCKENTVNDRFLSALYRKLSDPHITSTFHQAILLSLVYKTLTYDKQVDRIKVIIKRLLQIAIYAQPSMACGVLYVVSQVIRRNHALSALILPITPDEDDDDEDEKYSDVKEEPEEETNNESEAKPCFSWIHKKNSNKRRVGYNGLHRNPLHAGGEYCCYTELNFLKSHFHPTVALFAENLLNEKTINYTGDPLKDFSLIRFLDRFVFKNPKRAQDFPKEGLQSVLRARQNYRPKGIRAVPVQSTTYVNNDEENIPIEERFLYMYLQKRNKGAPAKDDDDDSDLDSVASEEFEEMLDKMIKIKDVGEDLDYMESIEEGFKSKKKRGKEESEEDVKEEEDEIDLDEDPFEPDEGDEEVFNEDDDDSEILFDSEEEESESKHKKAKKETSSLFASAEEFASMLEEEGAAKTAPGSSNAWSTKDNAHLRQIAWEEKRNQWLKGYNKTMGKGERSGFKSKRKQKGKQNGHNFQNKKKKKA
ncbi:hypothetical protein PPYR_13910 [Photinus pyralis]|uniref:CCAAT/enhancer-binding protein zeta n=1 Tax=Photinus pyralis TaxID=7054 RepID=A0A5N4A3V4_PHOPY|nr:CCAAT/enhancer-binding protein zeta isoform X2 [Photinus pyralis]KAB0791949.1 hypothetical protein PPYR_13910 [Photinus pyralis]